MVDDFVDKTRGYYLLLIGSGLFFLGFMGSFLLLIPKFSVIHYLTDRRICIRRHLNQIQAKLLRPLKSFCNRKDPQLFTLRPHDPQFRGIDLSVDFIIYAYTSPRMLAKFSSSHSV